MKYVKCIIILGLITLLFAGCTNQDLALENAKLKQMLVVLEEEMEISEQKYDDLVNTISEWTDEAIVICNMDGQVVNANDKYCDLLGYSLAELKEKTYHELTPEKWYAMEDSLRDYQVFMRGYSDIYEKEYVGKGGKIIPIRTRAWLLRDQSGNPSKFIGLVKKLSD
ncbi:PAS domain S-box protein [bacterium]|nr:MAG: PAS domain S-box protein [bacterium]